MFSIRQKRSTFGQKMSQDKKKVTLGVRVNRTNSAVGPESVHKPTISQPNFEVELWPNIDVVAM